MNLVVDIGNTLVKAAVFKENKLVEVIQQRDFSENDIEALVSKYKVRNGIYSSVRGVDATKMLTKCKFLALSHTTPLPLKNLYKTPETLGKDRIAGVVAAGAEFKGDNVLVIDMGTCVTYDFINANNEYLGGSISPGFDMRFKALNTFTGQLPKVEYKNENPELIGNSTHNSIMSGVFYGFKNELQGIINHYNSQYTNLKVVLTGGDIELFELEPKNRIFADKFLVLKGLNIILDYNAE